MPICFFDLESPFGAILDNLRLGQSPPHWCSSDPNPRWSQFSQQVTTCSVGIKIINHPQITIDRWYVYHSHMGGLWLSHRYTHIIYNIIIITPLFKHPFEDISGCSVFQLLPSTAPNWILLCSQSCQPCLERLLGPLTSPGYPLVNYKLKPLKLEILAWDCFRF